MIVLWGALMCASALLTALCLTLAERNKAKKKPVKTPPPHP